MTWSRTFFAAAMATLVFCVFACSQTAVAEEPSCLLTEEGKPKIRLVVGSRASRPSRFAAEELQRTLREISGATCPILTENPNLPGPVIAIGSPGENATTSHLLREAGVDFDSLELGTDGFLVQSVGPQLVVAGPTGRATLYAAYALLERLGCRWCFPGEYGDVIPNEPSLKLPPTKILEKPAFSYRTFMHHNHVTEETADWIDWMAKNRMNRFLVTLYAAKGYKGQRYAEFKKTPGLLDAIQKRGLSVEAGHHASYYWTPPEELYEKHPEWYALVNGKRGPVAVEGPRAQLCFSNRELADYTAERVLAFARANPEADIISLYTNDGYGYCECEACEALGTKTDAYVVYVNRIARRVYQEMPHIKLAFLSYSHVSDPPTKVRVFGKNTMCVVATWPPPKREQIQGWLDSGAGEVALYEYYMGSYSNRSIPSLWTEAIAEELKTIRDWGLVGVASQGELGNWGAYSLNYWVFARMIWDPALDVERVREDYYRHYYAEAAGPMKAYFTFLESLGRIPFDVDIPEEDLQKLETLLEAGEKAAASEAVQARVRRDRIGLDYLALAWRIEDGPRQAAALRAKGKFPEAIAQLEKAVAACEACLEFMARHRDERVFLAGRPDTPTENVKYFYTTRYYENRQKKLQRELEQYHRMAANPGAERNVALGKKVSAQSGKGSAGAAVDGDPGSLWVSGYKRSEPVNTAKHKLPQWFQVDLGEVMPVSKIVLKTPVQMYRYYIEASKDGRAWSRIVEKTDDSMGNPNRGFIHDVTPVDARFVRVTVTNNPKGAGHIAELEAYRSSE